MLRACFVKADSTCAVAMLLYIHCQCFTALWKTTHLTMLSLHGC